jgi:hypothetical protein
MRALAVPAPHSIMEAVVVVALVQSEQQVQQPAVTAVQD